MTFFSDADYRYYIAQMAESCRRNGVEVWAYCLMPNHVHLIAVPPHEDSLRAAVAEAHRRYTRRVNFRENWRGHLWQERFASFPMDEHHLLAAARYVEQNPVRARLVREPWEWKWSSASAHVAGKDDVLARAAPLLEMVGDWRGFVGRPVEQEQAELLRVHSRTGRPLGAQQFVKRLEAQIGRLLRRQRPGPKPQTKER
jgi:putative transposase